MLLSSSLPVGVVHCQLCCANIENPNQEAGMHILGENETEGAAVTGGAGCGVALAKSSAHGVDLGFQVVVGQNGAVCT